MVFVAFFWTIMQWIVPTFASWIVSPALLSNILKEHQIQMKQTNACIVDLVYLL